MNGIVLGKSIFNLIWVMVAHILHAGITMVLSQVKKKKKYVYRYCLQKVKK